MRFAAHAAARSLAARVGLLAVIAAAALGLTGCAGYSRDHPQEAEQLATAFRAVADIAGKLGAVAVAATPAAPVAPIVAPAANAITEQILAWIGLGVPAVGAAIVGGRKIAANARAAGVDAGRHIGWDEANGTTGPAAGAIPAGATAANG